MKPIGEQAAQAGLALGVGAAAEALPGVAEGERAADREHDDDQAATKAADVGDLEALVGEAQDEAGGGGRDEGAERRRPRAGPRSRRRGPPRSCRRSGGVRAGAAARGARRGSCRWCRSRRSRVDYGAGGPRAPGRDVSSAGRRSRRCRC